MRLMWFNRDGIPVNVARIVLFLGLCCLGISREILTVVEKEVR